MTISGSLREMIEMSILAHWGCGHEGSFVDCADETCADMAADLAHIVDMEHTLAAVGAEGVQAA